MTSRKRLTDAQIEKLGDRLIDTSNNIYLVAKTLYPNSTITDKDFDRLRELGKMFKCVECDRWWPTSEESEVLNQCQDCREEEIYQEEDDDQSGLTPIL